MTERLIGEFRRLVIERTRGRGGGGAGGCGGDGVLHTGCGAPVGRLVATDNGEAMVGVLRARVSAAGLSNVECTRADLYGLEFESENQEILQAIERVAEATGGRGLWVMDRAGDRRRILVPLLDDARRFLIRLRGDRHLRLPEEEEKEQERKSFSAFELAAICPLPYRETIVRQEPGGEQIWPLRFGARRVRLPDRPKVPLYLVVVEGPWQKPLVLLTTEKPGRSHRSHWRLVESYLARWRVEESIRFVKQSYQLEDIRLLRYDRLRAMVTLVLAAAYFAAVYLGRRAKLRLLHQHILRCSKRIFGVPEFRFYAAADGIKQLLFSSQRGLGPRSSALGATSSGCTSAPEKNGESPRKRLVDFIIHA